MNIGSIIKGRREELGLSQTDLALRLGYKDKSAISRIESGENDIPRRKIPSFAKALQLQPVDLIGQDEDLADLGNRLSPGEFALLAAFRSADRKTRAEVLRRLGIR
jgi:transcriptional regulator with XRE-family HTH domain